MDKWNRNANKRRSMQKNGKKGKLNKNKSNEFQDDLESGKEHPLDDIQSQTVQGDENRRNLQIRKQSLIGQNETHQNLNSKESIQENEQFKQSLNNQKSSSFATKKPHLLENEPSEHSQRRKKSIVPPYKRPTLLGNEQSENSQHRNSSNTSTSKKLLFERESSEESIHKKKSVSSPRKKPHSFETDSSDEELQKYKSKPKNKKVRHYSEEGKKRNQRKTKRDKSRQKKKRVSESPDSYTTDSSREPTPPVVIVDWSRHCKSMEQKVKKTINSHKVVVFAKKETDPNIEQVKNLMAQYCVTYGLVELDDSPYFETQLYNMTCCQCLPLIFIDGMFLGSLFELKTLEGMGRMKELSSKKVRKH